MEQCSSAQCFLRNSVRSIHFQAIFAMNRTLNDKAESVLLNASGRILTAVYDEFKQGASCGEETCAIPSEETEDQSRGNGFHSS